MLTPRLTNCQDCHKIPDLPKQIDCKLAELANDAYNDVVFMLGNCIPAYEINQLLAYKRILTFKYCNCLLYTSPSPRDRQKSRMPSSA